MNTKKLIYGVLSLCMVFSAASCSDDDNYGPATGEILTQVTTEGSVVTATTAVTTGTVKDLSTQAASAYKVGVVYGTSADPTVNGTKVDGAFDTTGGKTVADGVVKTQLTGLTTGTKYYYATYVTLQGTYTRYGEVQELTATNSMVATVGHDNVTSTKATLSGLVDGVVDATDLTALGFELSTSEDDVKAGNALKVPAEELVSNYTVNLKGLLPGTTYYYRAYTMVGTTMTVAAEIKSFTTPAQVMEYVDLGLSVKWAKCNVGAEAEEEIGALMGYGDQTGLNRSFDMSKYANENIAGTDKDNLLNVKMDADATFKSVMPTTDQIYELISKTTQTPDNVNGVDGIRFTAANGNSIFLPFTGYREGTEVVSTKSGFYWSGQVNSENTAYASNLSIDASGVVRGVSARPLGIAVRSVQKTMFQGFQASLSTVDSGWAGEWGDEGKGTNADVTGYGTYTVTTNAHVNDAMIFLIDIYGAASVYNEENTVATIDKIVVDGKEVACDNSKIQCGDIEGKGNFRIEIYNIYGKTAEGADKPYTVANPPIDIAAINGEKVEVTFTLKKKAGLDLAFDNSKLAYGDIENNGKLRIQLFNEWGGPQVNGGQAMAKESIKFDKNIAVTFSISGLGTLSAPCKAWIMESNVGQWNCGNEYTEINGDGTYTVMLHGSSDGPSVFNIDIEGVKAAITNGVDIAATADNNYQPSGINVKIEAVNVDVTELEVNNNMVAYGDIENNGKLRIQLFNEWGGPQVNGGQAVAKDAVDYESFVAVTFTISGLGTLSAPCKAWVMESSANRWNLDKEYVSVTGDGTYTVYVHATAKEPSVFLIDTEGVKAALPAGKDIASTADNGYRPSDLSVVVDHVCIK